MLIDIEYELHVFYDKVLYLWREFCKKNLNRGTLIRAKTID